MKTLALLFAAIATFLLGVIALGMTVPLEQLLDPGILQPLRSAIVISTAIGVVVLGAGVAAAMNERTG